MSMHMGIGHVCVWSAVVFVPARACALTILRTTRLKATQGLSDNILELSSVDPTATSLLFI